MAVSNAAAAATLTGRLPGLSSQRNSKILPQERLTTIRGVISYPSRSWGHMQILGQRRIFQQKHPDGPCLGSSFKGEAVELATGGQEKVTRGRRPIQAVLPAILVPPNIVQTAPSFLARLIGFYVLLRAGITVPYKKEETEEEQETKTLRATKKWKIHNNTILQRKYRCSSPQDGRKKLRALCDVLSDDDTFKTSDTHKGCQVRRENAHAETVCCNGVSCIYDDLPFPHMKIEISRFPLEGRVGMEEYYKAEKLEAVLNTRIK